MRKILGLGLMAMLAFWASPASATPVTAACTTVVGGTAGGGGGVSGAYTTGAIPGGNTGCNVLITFNADGSITTTHPNAAISYDVGGDDNLVGIVNLTSAPIFSLTLHGTNTPFGFDGDGICDPTWTFAGGATPCTGPNGGAPVTGYGIFGESFSGISGDLNTGTVNFAGGIASGAASFFSLEGPVDLNLTVRPVPEPASLLLFGTGALALARRRRKQ